MNNDDSERLERLADSILLGSGIGAAHAPESPTYFDLHRELHALNDKKDTNEPE